MIKQVSKEERNITIKICALLPLLMAAFLLLGTMNAQAKTMTPATDGLVLSQISGPSQSFLNDWNGTVRYKLVADDVYYYDIYASGVLSDGTVIFACEENRFVAILPSGILVEGEWGTEWLYEALVPQRVFKNYTFTRMK